MLLTGINLSETIPEMLEFEQIVLHCLEDSSLGRVYYFSAETESEEKKDFALNSFRCDPFFSFACDFQRKIPSDNVFPEKSLPFFVHPSCPRLISIELWIGIKFRGKNLCQRKSHIFSCHYVLFALWNIRIPDKMARHSKHAILLMAQHIFTQSFWFNPAPFP